MRQIECVVLSLLAVGLWGCSQKTDTALETSDAVEIMSVVKGDELLAKKGETPLTLRLLGIYAFSEVDNEPKLEALGADCKAHLAKTLVGKTVTVALGKTPRDVHGRYLVTVADEDGHDVNRALIAEGRAVVYTEYGFGKEAEYLKVEAAARKAKKLMWADTDAVELIHALRGMWREAREKRTGKTPPDPWLAAIDALGPGASPADLDEAEGAE